MRSGSALTRSHGEIMSALNHKLLRDLWRIKGQAGAIALVVAVGVMLLVMMAGMLSSLVETRETYYERYRLADIFAPVTRAPQGMHRDIDVVIDREPRQFANLHRLSVRKELAEVVH